MVFILAVYTLWKKLSSYRFVAIVFVRRFCRWGSFDKFIGGMLKTSTCDTLLWSIWSHKMNGNCLCSVSDDEFQSCVQTLDILYLSPLWISICLIYSAVKLWQTWPPRWSLDHFLSPRYQLKRTKKFLRTQHHCYLPLQRNRCFNWIWTPYVSQRLLEWFGSYLW